MLALHVNITSTADTPQLMIAACGSLLTHLVGAEFELVPGQAVTEAQ